MSVNYNPTTSQQSIKTSWFEIFLIYRRCHWQWWLTFTYEYLHNNLKWPYRILKDPRETDSWKILKLKIWCQIPFKRRQRSLSQKADCHPTHPYRWNTENRLSYQSIPFNFTFCRHSYVLKSENGLKNIYSRICAEDVWKWHRIRQMPRFTPWSFFSQIFLDYLSKL